MSFSQTGQLLLWVNTLVTTARRFSVDPYGDNWRNLRRICAVEIFSSGRLKASLEIRSDEVRSLLRTIPAATSKGGGGNNSVQMELIYFLWPQLLSNFSYSDLELGLGFVLYGKKIYTSILVKKLGPHAILNLES